ncbi:MULTISPECIES: IS3 family transposase [Flavobacterium]|uniref:IS3 family transposase n=1 Tax=Flavobacterium TaxID=237 RepID=UPI001F3F3558|nr:MULTISPECIES: IS3 family transposase [Flavobacterium]
MNKSENRPAKRSQRDYNLGFKLAVISQVEKGELTYKQAQKKYGIQGRSTVLVWLRKFGNLDWSNPKLLFMVKSKETPAQSIKRLEKELADEKLKNTVLNTMIDISDSQYGTQIRKKFSPKPIRRIQQEEGISMSRTCRLFGVSRQAIYQQEARCLEREKELLIVKQLVEKQRRIMPRLGTRKLYFLLEQSFVENRIKIGRDAFFAYLKREKMLVKPMKNYTKTTFSKHWLRKYPNLFKDIDINRIEQVFVSDITYIKSNKRTHYLSLVTDVFSRKIVGYHLSDDMSAESVVKALRMAVKNRKTNLQLIHHSDRGLQYCSKIYQNELTKNNIIASITDGYDCYQNALAERINGILKQEFLIYKCKSGDELNLLVRESVECYNSKRPHLSLNMKTPNFVYEKTSEVNFTGFN